MSGWQELPGEPLCRQDQQRYSIPGRTDAAQKQVCAAEGHLEIDITPLGSAELHWSCNRCGHRGTHPRPGRMGDEVYRITVRTKQEIDLWCAFVAELGYDPKRIRNKVLITRDNEHGYRLHLSVKTTNAQGRDILDHATNDVVSTPLVIPITPEQVTHLVRGANGAN